MKLRDELATIKGLGPARLDAIEAAMDRHIERMQAEFVAVRELEKKSGSGVPVLLSDAARRTQVQTIQRLTAEIARQAKEIEDLRSAPGSPKHLRGFLADLRDGATRGCRETGACAYCGQMNGCSAHCEIDKALV